jgi:hypothetical protein
VFICCYRYTVELTPEYLEMMLIESIAINKENIFGEKVLNLILGNYMCKVDVNSV